MSIESGLQFTANQVMSPANRVLGAAVHAGEAIMNHYGNPHALQNAEDADARLTALRLEEPEIYDPIPRAMPVTWRR